MFRPQLSCGLAGVMAAASVLSAPAAAQIVFQPPVKSDAGLYSERVAIGDVNEDGLPDAAVSHFPFGPTPTLSLGLPGGGFGPPQILPGLDLPREIPLMADFDEDGHLDLLVVGPFTQSPNVGILFGDGRGGFGPLQPANSSQPAPLDADVGDFNSDGALDITVISGMFTIGNLGALTVRFGNGDGTFAPAVTLESFGWDNPGGDLVRAGDTNGDGFDDIVFEGQNPVMLSLGNGTFQPGPCPGDCASFVVRDLELVDVNGDGRDDALTPTGVYLALPDGSLATPIPLASQFFHHRAASGDFDDDGLIDVVVGRNLDGNFFWPESTFGDVIFMRGQGDGNFATPGVVVSHVPQPSDIVVTDIDHDGRLDAVVSNLVEPDPTLSTLLNHTYGPGSAFTDLGGALAGSNGYPIQLASGTLVAGQPFSFKLANGPPNGAAFHIVGLSALNAPFKFGTLIPFPNLVNGPLPLNGSGFINLAANWPAGGSGLTLWVQFWMPNGGGPVGFVASSGVRAQIP